MANNTSRTTLEQGRATFAFTAAQEGANLSAKKEYKAYVKKLPMLIKTNGLGAAMAFVYSKGYKGNEPKRGDAWATIYQQIEEWLKQDEKQLISFNEKQLAKKLTEINSSQYRAIAVEILALLNWIRRFAEGLIEGEATNND